MFNAIYVVDIKPEAQGSGYWKLYIYEQGEKQHQNMLHDSYKTTLQQQRKWKWTRQKINM